MSALFGQPLTPSTDFPAEARVGSFDRDARGLRTTTALTERLRDAAEALAARTVANPTTYKMLVPCTPGATGCADAFVKAFGLRAFRRPLSAREQTAYVALFGKGPDLIASGDAFRDGVQTVVEVMLKQPDFVYRWELASGRGDGLLAEYAMASRLSYALWNSMPDERLFTAAATGELRRPDALAAQVSRLLDDARAAATVADFHAQWLDARDFGTATKSSTKFPSFGAVQLASLERELRTNVATLYTEGGGFAEVLTGRVIMADKITAKLYGLAGTFGDAPTRVELPVGQRSGLFTQIGFLAANASGEATSPIRRAVALHRQLFCTALPPPPPGIDPTPPPFSAAIKTRRQQVEAQTSGAVCSGCHAIINPAGFAFELYDAVGVIQRTDNGVVVDAAGQITLDGASVPFRDAIELMAAAVRSPQVQTCYAQRWSEFLLGRPPGQADAQLTTAAAAAAATGSLRRLIQTVVTHPAFFHAGGRP